VKPLVAVSIGCPSGIGPEVSVAAAAKLDDATCLLVGDAKVIARAARVVGVAAARLVPIDDPLRARQILGKRRGAIGVFAPPAGAVAVGDAPFGRPTPAAGRAQLAWIDAATDLVDRGVADALVTGPVSKHAIASSNGGRRADEFRGHTEHLARTLGAREVVMAFWSERLTIALATTHLPLRRVAAALTPRAVAAAVFHNVTLVASLHKGTPRVAVTGLNPHAGEQGLLGDEERTIIARGIERARRRLARAEQRADVQGPIGAETAIRFAAAGAYDAVVAMYHDQATIPMKLVGFGQAVNVTLGLRIIRTSVDHGTGYDVAGTGKAAKDGMVSAMVLAARLARSRRLPSLAR
jgi:4-hydroxythreonine-4-phosphate dehydrogenase